MKLQKTTSIILASLTVTACIRSQPMPEAGSHGSKLVSVSMKMPTKIGDKDISGKMDGYALSIKKTGGDCAFPTLTAPRRSLRVMSKSTLRSNKTVTTRLF